MSSLMSRMGMAVIASFTMTMLIVPTATWAFQRSGYSVALSILLWILFPATFFLSSTALEYLQDGNIARSLTVSLYYTGIAAVLIIGLYFVTVAVSPRSRVARYHHRSSPTIAIAALPSQYFYRVWSSCRA
jgi:hypothetical protein